MNNPAIIQKVSVTSGRLPIGNLVPTMVPSNRNRKKPDRFASLAHEIRNPLSTMTLAAEMLKSITTEDDQKKFLDMIIRGTRRINDILADIHSVSRGNEMNTGKHSVNQLLDEALEIAGDKIRLNDITVRKNYAIEDFKIEINRPQILIALTNIIINAVDAMAGVKGVLTLVTISTVETCIVQIEDNGCGIREENLNNIFEPYFTNKPDGLGLGLATTRNILRSNHVGLNVKSTVAKGTNFVLRFGENDHNKLLQRIRNVPQLGDTINEFGLRFVGTSLHED
jgi:signal transduction histidine kinase